MGILVRIVKFRWTVGGMRRRASCGGCFGGEGGLGGSLI